MMTFIKILFLFIILNAFSGISFSQGETKKETEIINLTISFEQKRRTKPTQAKKDIEKAIAIAKTLKNKEKYVSSMILLGEFYDDNGDFNKAFSLYSEALSIAEESNDIEGMALCKYDLGFLFYKQGTKEKKKIALNNFESAISFSELSGNNFLAAKSYNSASFIYLDLDEIEKAKQSSLKALGLFRVQKKRRRMAQCYLSLSRVHNKKDDYSTALNYLDSSLFIFENLNNQAEINNALLAKSEIYYRKKEFKKAINFAKEVENSPTVMGDQKLFAYELLYKINKSINKSSTSLDYLEKSEEIKDSLNELARDRMMESVASELDAKNQLEILEKEKKINDLELEKSRYWFWALIGISALLLLISLVSYLFYRQNKLKSEKEKIRLEQHSIQLEQNLLRTQMNPHFIANSLAAIQGNIYKQDKEKSVTYLSKFAKLMRFILESSREKEVFLDKEINSLKNYLDLQKLLLEDKLNYKISVAENVETEELKIPPMLFQPYVENAIVHGVELKKENGNVHINFELLDNSRLEVTIEDDGLGREKVSEMYKKRNLKHLSFSTNITNERIELLNVKSKNRIEIKTEDVLVNDLISGTRVTLILPVTNVFD